MPLATGEKYAGTIKLKDGRFRRAVTRLRGAKIIRWEMFDGKGAEVVRAEPQTSLETVPKPEGEAEPMPAAKDRGAAGEGAAGATGETGADSRIWPWIVVAGVVLVGAAVGAALWTRRRSAEGALPGKGLFARLKLVA